MFIMDPIPHISSPLSSRSSPLSDPSTPVMGCPTNKADSFMFDTIDPSLLELNPPTPSPLVALARNELFQKDLSTGAGVDTGCATGLATGIHMASFQGSPSDSECSWDEDDQNTSIQDSLRALREETETFRLTDHLSRRQRRLVHTMATVLQLNHVTLGKGKTRRVLVSKERISPTLNGQPRSRCWNRFALPSEDYDVILPERIGISGIPTSVTMDQVLSELISYCLPAPREAVWSVIGNDRVACLDFNAADDAAAIVAASGNFFVMDRSSLKVTYCTARISQSVYGIQQPNQASLEPTPPVALKTPSLHSSLRRGSDCFASIDSLSIYSTSKTSSTHTSINPNSLTDDLPGYTSGESTTTMRSVYSTQSSLRASRRRRLPASTAGYPCRAEDCNRTFNRAGDRTKHERIHSPDSQTHPHQCLRCAKSFMYPKDLRRHEVIHDREAAQPSNKPAAGANLSWCMRVDAATGGACKSIFMDREDELQHMRAHHGGVRSGGTATFICPVCAVGGWTMRSDLLEHLYIEHAP